MKMFNRKIMLYLIKFTHKQGVNPMQDYIVTIEDIEDITKPIFLDEKLIIAEDKTDAQDKAHVLAEAAYPDKHRLISVRVA